MQSVSAAWKALQEQLYINSPSYVEVSYNVGDAVAQLDASASDNGHITIADTAQTTDGTDKTYAKYVTLEKNDWVLNGALPVLPDGVTQDTGFISSEISEADAKFSTNPVITLSFASLHTQEIPGITIQWSESFDEYAVGFVVTAYNGASVVASETVTDNHDLVSAVLVDIDNYDKITIEITEWCLPYTRARIEQITLGVISVFTKSELLGYEHSQFVDILSAECPKAEVVFYLSNVNDEWNPDNPDGLWQYLAKRQKITVRYGYFIGDAIEWIKGGSFYLSDWVTPSDGLSASFTARDLLEFMQGDFTTASTTITLYDLAIEALELAELPKLDDGSDPWSVDSSLDDITITVPADFTYSIMEVLQLCANAACCVFYQDRSGIVRIEPLSTTLTDYVINKTISYTSPEYEITKELKSVSVNDGMGTASNSATGEVQTIENPLIQDSTVANAVAAWVKGILQNRRNLSGEYRADPRMDALDKVTVSSKYADSVVYISTIKYAYNGAFRGEYGGKAVL